MTLITVTHCSICCVSTRCGTAKGDVTSTSRSFVLLPTLSNEETQCQSHIQMGPNAERTYTHPGSCAETSPTLGSFDPTATPKEIFSKVTSPNCLVGSWLVVRWHVAKNELVMGKRIPDYTSWDRSVIRLTKTDNYSKDFHVDIACTHEQPKKANE